MDGLDTTVAHPARRYNYWLGGKDNFAADRASGDELEALFPKVRQGAIANRAVLRRATRFLAGEAGIRQFLDIGTGLPTADNTHEVAQADRPGEPDRLRRQRPAGDGARPGPAHQQPRGRAPPTSRPT